MPAIKDYRMYHIRQALGLTQRACARTLGVTQGMYSQYETGFKMLPIGRALALKKTAADYGLTVTLLDIYGG